MPLIQALGYIFQSGKRLRPMLSILAAQSQGYAGNQHIQLAAIVELIHTSTLLHDDVVDHSDLRRGQKTANAVFGLLAHVRARVTISTVVHFTLMSELNNIAIIPACLHHRLLAG